MNPLPLVQPPLESGALGLFAEASVALAAASDSETLRNHAEVLARLTQSDLVLVYEATSDSGPLTLVAQWGLDDDGVHRFATLGLEQATGAGGLRAGRSDPTPLFYRPRTQELEDLGIRAYWGYPLWSQGELAGQVFFGSRNWDEYHEDTLSVFAATTLQIAQALGRRKSASAPDESSWSESGSEAAVRKRQQFIAVLAHELRNPIAPIRTGIDLIATGLLDEEARLSTTQMMQRQVAHLVRLIDDLLDTVRLDTGKLQIKREPVVLQHVIRSAIESIRPALEARAQALKLDDRTADLVVDADPVRLAQAFVNILNVNVKQTPERGIVSVRVTSSPDSVQVAFEDESVGAIPADGSNVFDLFPRLPLESLNDGLGIGLGLVKGLVELNDGSVNMRVRDEGGGAVYTVSLPIAPVDGSTLNPPAHPPDDWPSHRILIVDDNRDAANTLGLLLELDGHTIRIAHDGPAAVDEALGFQPEVILMDIGLPGFSGNEATRRIRSAAPAVRPFIIAVTGWGAHSDREATAAAGCDMHLVKPVAHDELRKAIGRITARSSVEAEANDRDEST